MAIKNVGKITILAFCTTVCLHPVSLNAFSRLRVMYWIQFVTKPDRWTDRQRHPAMGCPFQSGE